MIRSMQPIIVAPGWRTREIQGQGIFPSFSVLRRRLRLDLFSPPYHPSSRTTPSQQQYSTMAVPVKRNCTMAARRRRSPWPDLPPDLLGLVLRLLPSLADRVRLRAVCEQWRQNAKLEVGLPPRLPWLALPDGTFLTIPGGEETHHRVPHPLPNDARFLWHCHGSVGSDDWLFFHDRYKGKYLVMNPFTEDDMFLPKLTSSWLISQRCTFFKMVLLSSRSRATPRDCVSAVLMRDATGDTTVISICRPPSAHEFRVPKHEYVFDIAFYDGKLYALSLMKLFVVEIESAGVGKKPRVSSMEPVMDSTDDPESTFRLLFRGNGTCRSYLVESGGRLLHVRRLIRAIPGDASSSDDHGMIGQSRTFSFEVFEADFTGASRCRWKRVDSLEGQALFVGTSSRSLPAFECGAQEDCIYFMDEDDRGNYYSADPLRDSGVFNMRNGVITPLLPESAVIRSPGDTMGRPVWFFPVHALLLICVAT